MGCIPAKGIPIHATENLHKTSDEKTGCLKAISEHQDICQSKSEDSGTVQQDLEAHPDALIAWSNDDRFYREELETEDTYPKMNQCDHESEHQSDAAVAEEDNARIVDGVTDQAIAESITAEDNMLRAHETEIPELTLNSSEAEPDVAEPVIVKKKLVIHKLTEEEIDKCMSRIEECIKCIKENFSLETITENKAVRNSILFLKAAYSVFRNTSDLNLTTELRQKIGRQIVDSGVASILCNFIVHVLAIGLKSDDGLLSIDLYKPFYNSFVTVFNYSDCCSEIAIFMCNADGFLESIVAKLVRYYPLHLEQYDTLLKEELTFIRNSLGLCHNCCVVDENRQRLHELGLPEIQLQYATQSKDDKFRLSALLGLAEILDEEGCKAFQAGADVVKFLLSVLESASKSKHHRDKRGWSAYELTRGVQHMALCDANKRMLVECGALPILHTICQSKLEQEQREALCALWTLSFDDYNKEMIVKDTDLMNTLTVLRQSDDSEVRRIVAGIMWTIRDKDKPQRTASARRSRVLADPNQHIMISYQTESRLVLLHVRDALKEAGYRVWMDVDDISGSTLQSMAEAVENSTVVLVCISQKYKDSQNCRAEAEYAFNRQRPIIPLLMQSHYKADGWLGIIMGAKFYYEFTAKINFDSKFVDLVKGVESIVKSGRDFVDSIAKKSEDVVNGRDEVEKEQPVVAKQSSGTVNAGIQWNRDRSDIIRQWTTYNVSEWKTKNKLGFHLQTRDPVTGELKAITGEELAFLWELKSEAPDFFYRLLETQMGVSSIQDLASFVREIKALFLQS